MVGTSFRGYQKNNYVNINLTYYDKLLRIEFSINHLGEKGVFLHFSNPTWKNSASFCAESSPGNRTIYQKEAIKGPASKRGGCSSSSSRCFECAAECVDPTPSAAADDGPNPPPARSPARPATVLAGRHRSVADCDGNGAVWRAQYSIELLAQWDRKRRPIPSHLSPSVEIFSWGWMIMSKELNVLRFLTLA